MGYLGFSRLRLSTAFTFTFKAIDGIPRKECLFKAQELMANDLSRIDNFRKDPFTWASGIGLHFPF